MMLDTNIISVLRTGRNKDLNSWFRSQPGDVCLSAVTITELQFGASNLEARKPGLAAELAEWIDGLLATTSIIPLDAEAARLLGRMQAVGALRQLAADPPDAPRYGSDLGIAATAIAASMPLATLNLRDFHLIARHFPTLRVVDPMRSR